MTIAELEGKKARTEGKNAYDCPYGEEGSWDEKHARVQWFKGWCYGQEDGDQVEVEVVDLGKEANAALKKLYQEPTNLSELGL